MSVESSWSPPGGVTYSSNTMNVGDATWDATKNTFLLPNLQGYNLATTQYNGMGNRFSTDARYRNLIIAHGVIAALVFLLVMPLAVFVAKFYHTNGRHALRLHIALQMVALVFLTAVIVIAIFAVGTARSLTNPHHGIGIAIYALVVLQTVAGILMRWSERKKPRPYRLPLKLMIHKWLGRAVVLLGIAQVALGLTLYGSPLWLFIAYAIIVFLWLIALFVCCYRAQGAVTAGTKKRANQDALESNLYTDDPLPVEKIEPAPSRRLSKRRKLASALGQPARTASHNSTSTKSHALRDTALAGGAIAAFEGWRRRSKGKRDGRPKVERHHSNDQPSTNGSLPSPRSRRSSLSSVDYEKQHTVPTSPTSTWRDRILGPVAGLGAYQGAKALSHRRPSYDSRVPERLNYPSPTSRPAVSSMAGQPAAYTTTPAQPVTAQPGTAAPITVLPVAKHDTWQGNVPARQVSFISPAHSAIAHGNKEYSGHGHGSQEGDHSSYGSGDEDSYDNIGVRALETLAAVTGFAAIRRRLRERQERKDDQRLDEMYRLDQEHAEHMSRLDSLRNRHGSARVHDFDAPRTQTPMVAPVKESEVVQVPAAGAPVVDGGSVAPFHRGVAIPPVAMSTEKPVAARHSFGSESSQLNRPTPTELRIPGLHQPVAPALPVAPAAESSVGGYAESADLSSVHMAEPPVSVKVKIHNNHRHVTLRKLNDAEIAAQQAKKKAERRGGSAWRYIPPPPALKPAVAQAPGIATPAQKGTAALMSPGAGYASDASAFEENRKRRRAERANQRAAQALIP